MPIPAQTTHPVSQEAPPPAAGASADQMATTRTSLAGMRTLLGADRTLMAWVRTSLSLLSFGFSIYKILQGFEEAGRQMGPGTGPRNAGLLLTGMGTLAMVMGSIDYYRNIRELRPFQETRGLRFPLVMAAIMSLAGVMLFLSIATRLF